jgi:hypothetical protein
VFSPVKSDIGGNIAKLKTALSQKSNKVSLQKLVLDEKAAGKSKDSATSLLWFSRCVSPLRYSFHFFQNDFFSRRAMSFIFMLLKKVSAGLDANKAAKEAYEETLALHHGFMVRNTFQMGLMAAPSTDSMLQCLGSDKVTAEVESLISI